MNDIVQKIYLVQPDEGSAEDVLGVVNPIEEGINWTEEQERAYHSTANKIEDELAADDLLSEAEIDAHEQAEQMAEEIVASPIAAQPIDSTRIAEIPAVDRPVDPVIERQPVDIRIGGNHYKNPG
jgi:hypothetical protein